MGIRSGRRFAAVVCLWAAVWAAAGAEGLLSARWKSTVTQAGARPGQPLEEAEIWLQGGRMRVEERGKGPEKTNVLEADGEVYVWAEGQSTGTKMGAGLAARSGRPSHGYVRRVGEIRARGQKIGVETVDGHPCDVYAFESAREGKGTYWLAKDLQGFPVRAIVERVEVLPERPRVELARVKLEYRNTDVRIPGKFPASLLEVPASVQFQDVTELMLRGPGPRR